MRVVDRNNRVSLSELRKMADDTFGDLIKAVVAVKRDMLVVDAELHADEEALLIEKGSNQADLWGVNLYSGIEGDDFVEYDSMINLRPSRGNRSRHVEGPEVREYTRNLLTDRVIR